MTQDNRALAEQFWAMLQSGDRSGVLALLADTIDWFVPGDPALVPWAGQRRTRGEVEEFLGMLGGAMVPEENRVEETVADGDNVVLLGYFRHRSKSTDRVFASPYALHLKIYSGQIVRYHIYEDTQALVDTLR